MQKQYLGDTADTEKVGGTYADNEEVENKVSEDEVSVTDPAKVVNGSCQTEIHIITLIHIITIYPTQFCFLYLFFIQIPEAEQLAGRQFKI